MVTETRTLYRYRRLDGGHFPGWPMDEKEAVETAARLGCAVEKIEGSEQEAYNVMRAPGRPK